MDKVLFFGTDLHNSPTELASKTVRKLSLRIPNSHVLSIQNVKNNNSKKEIAVIPRLTKIQPLRLFFQSILLPIYFTAYRLKGYKKIATFWTVNNLYHLFLFWYLKLLGFETYFTVISAYNKNYNSLKYCKVIICQSERMRSFLSSMFPEKTLKVIRPGIDLGVFKPSKKDIDIIIGSVPYSPSDLHLRGLDKVLDFLKENSNLSAVIISRSSKTSEFISKMNLKNIKIISKSLSEKDLAGMFGRSRGIVLLHKIAPDMPLSGIEAMACGCSVICSDNMGLVEIIQKNNCGIVYGSLDDTLLISDIKSLSKRPFQKRCRNAAEKFFNLEANLKKYKKLLLDV